MPSSSKRSASNAAGVGVETREKVFVVLDDRDVGAHAPEELRELDADRSAAEHDEAGRNRARPDGLAVRPVLDVCEPVERRQRRLGAGRHDELVVLELAFADGDDARPDDPRIASHELGTLIREPSRVPRVVPTVRHLVAPPEDAFDVDLAGDRLGGSGSEARRGERFGRPQQRLRRKARVVRALAAGELPLDDRDLGVGVEPPQRTDEVLAARAGAEHHARACLPSNGEGGI